MKNTLSIEKVAMPLMVMGAVIGLFCLLGGCGEKGNTSALVPQAMQEEEQIPVRTALVEQRKIALPVQSSGMLTSSAEQRLSFKIGGVIRKTYVDEGDVVRPGQLLATLDKTEIDAQVAQAQQGLTKSERDLARVQGLYKDSSATLELLENATTGRDVAKESARIAQFNQQYAEIRATRGGKIIKKLMNEGEITGPGTPVFVLFETGTDDWVVRINVSDRDWARLNTGMSARIMMDAYEGTTFMGKVSELAPAADPQNGLYPVEIRLVTQGKRFAPGLFAQVEISTVQARSYAVVPISAIVEGNGKSAFVFVVQPDGQSVRKLPVQIASLEGDKALIINGLENVSEVVTNGAPYLSERKKVLKL
jgi:membrane fusion protein, multidrug efflux system